MQPTLSRTAYFERIGYDGPEEPTLEVLNRIVLQHATHIPFENLDPLLGKTVRLDPQGLEEKLLRAGRGGYCFEQNLLLLDVLTELGFDVKPLGARVMWGRAPVDPVSARTHALLEVTIDGRAYIADVGFGGLTLTSALRLVPDVVQETPHDRVRLSRLDDALVLEAELDGSYAPLYRFDRSRQYRADYELASWFLCNSPASHFRHGLMAARAAVGARFALRNNQLTERRPGAVNKRRIEGPAELARALSDVFGIRLPRDAELETVLTRIAASQ